LYSNTTGSNNTASGNQAGRYISGGSTANQTSTNSLYLGYDAYALASGDTNEAVIGNTAVGAGSNTTVIGNASVTDTYLGSSSANSLAHASGFQFGGTTYSAAGTPLPTCNSGSLLKVLPVSDATTLHVAYVSGGTYTASVECDYNSSGTTYAWEVH